MVLDILLDNYLCNGIENRYIVKSNIKGAELMAPQTWPGPTWTEKQSVLHTEGLLQIDGLHFEKKECRVHSWQEAWN